MVLGYHCVFSTHGFWLPNDPRGSWSDWVRSWELLRFGAATKVETTTSLAPQPHDRAKRLAAKAALQYPEVVLTGLQARAAARGFQRAIEESGYVVYACSILPQHIHLVIARHARKVEQIISHLKARATQQMKLEGLHPLAAYKDESGAIPSPWSRRMGWKVFLNSAADILRAIRYVEMNPIKEDLPAQRWSFIVPYAPRHA